MANPIPFNIVPVEGEAPKGSIPVALFGIDGAPENLEQRLSSIESRLDALETAEPAE